MSKKGYEYSDPRFEEIKKDAKWAIIVHNIVFLENMETDIARQTERIEKENKILLGMDEDNTSSEDIRDQAILLRELRAERKTLRDYLEKYLYLLHIPPLKDEK